MPFPRVLEHYDRDMQRLGFLKHMMARAVALSGTTIEMLGRDLVTVASQKVQVELTPERRAYITRRLFDRNYKALRDKVAQLQKSGSQETPIVSLELQDVCLADPRVPSGTGKLTPGRPDRCPIFGLSLGLLRKGTLTAMVRGIALLQLTRAEELNGFKTWNPDINPLLLDEGQRLFFLYCLLQEDGDIVRPVYSQLLEAGQSFSDRDAGDLLPAIFRDIEKSTRSEMLKAEERERARQLARAADNIEKWKGKSYTGMSARGEAITVRVEPWVDIGLLHKPDRYAFRYDLTHASRVFFARLRDAESVEAFIMTDMFSAWNEATGAGAVPEEPHRIVEAVLAAYDELKSPLKFAPILETLLLAGIRSFVDRRRYFELGRAAALLRSLQKQEPHWISFNIDRRGTLKYLRFESKQMPAFAVAEEQGEYYVGGQSGG